jgi:hypothetical protein
MKRVTLQFTLCCVAVSALAISIGRATEVDPVLQGAPSTAAAACPAPGKQAQVTRIFRVTQAGEPEVLDNESKKLVGKPELCSAKAGNVSQSPDPPHVRLRETIAMCVANLGTLRAQLDCANKDGGARKLVLFINGRPLPDIATYPPTDPDSNLVMFQLSRTEKSRDAWATILGKPGWDSKDTLLSVGMDDGHAAASHGYVRLDVLPQNWFLFWLAIFVGLLIGFFVLAVKTDVLRDSGSVPGDGARRRFSLARTQAAWWFFLILAAYLFIGIVTGDFATSITGTALTLLGISAGTTVGSAFIDASNNTPADRRVKDAETTRLQSELPQLDAAISGLKKDPPAATDNAQTTRQQAALRQPDSVLADLKLATGDAETVAAKEAELATKQSQLRKLKNESEDFLKDVLSDANGVNFHRFQILAWTIVMGIIFIAQVFHELAMPEFSGTLLGLMGISAATYLGLKIPEDTVPKK